MGSLRDRLGIIIVKHLGSRNPSYPDDSYTARRFVALAEELERMVSVMILQASVKRAVIMVHQARDS